MMAFENAGAFRKAMLAWAEDVVPDRLTQWQKRIVFEAFSKVIIRTPRDEGILIGGWVITIDWYPAQVTSGKEATPEEVKGKNSGVLAGLKPFRVVFIDNTLDDAYGYVLEEGKFDPSDPGPSKDKRPDRKGKILVKGGYSTQAPQGMVGITFQELKAKYAGTILE